MGLYWRGYLGAGEFVPLNADVRRFLDPFIEQKGEKEAIREASAISYVSKDDPPFLEILGTQDGYIPMSEAINLQAALHAVRVRCDIIVAPLYSKKSSITYSSTGPENAWSNGD